MIESNNTPEIDAPKGTAVQKVIEFLDKYLPSFPADFRTRTTNIGTIRENLISRELNIYLNRLRRENDIFMFEFQWEDENSKRSSDVGVIAVENQNPGRLSQAFFLIEAKRLPTPGTGREKEYIEGNFGGMQRYKKGHHGNGLSDGGLIGYVQDNDCNYWYNQITNWISDLIQNCAAIDIEWNSGDLLIFDRNLTTTQKYVSTNTRIVNSTKDTIKLYHYLMNLN